MKHLNFIFILAFVAQLIFSNAQAQDLKPYYNTDKNGLWVDGYDPVSYLTVNKAVKGKSEISSTYKGATFYFSSATNRDLFKKDPEKYLPQYGGYCAYGIGDHNEKVPVNPETFTVMDGKVFLFYNRFFDNTLTDWKKDEKNLYQQAEKNWKTQKHSAPKK